MTNLYDQRYVKDLNEIAKIPARLGSPIFREPITMTNIVLLSGGLDSTVLLSYVRAYYQPSPVIAVSFNYGQRHVKELDAAAKITSRLGVEHIIFDLRVPFEPIRQASRSSLLAGDVVPHGLYDAENMKSTIVPNRNMIMSAFAIGLADARALASGGESRIHLATHRGDHAIYPDCTMDFNQALFQTARIATEDRVGVRMLFETKLKSDIVRLGADSGAPMDLSWSCYEGGDVHCGHCGTCVERIEAFTNAEIIDPTEYDSDGYAEAIHLLKSSGKIR
jgi:7-cyano-7-deazaguanine synthase